MFAINLNMELLKRVIYMNEVFNRSVHNFIISRENIEKIYKNPLERMEKIILFYKYHITITVIV